MVHNTDCIPAARGRARSRNTNANIRVPGGLSQPPAAPVVWAQTKVMHTETQQLQMEDVVDVTESQTVFCDTSETSSGYFSELSDTDIDLVISDYCDSDIPESPSPSPDSGCSQASTWEEKILHNSEKYTSMSILPTWTIWSPTNEDDSIIDNLVLCTKERAVSSPVNSNADIVRAANRVSWGVFAGWYPLPSYEEAAQLLEIFRREEEEKKIRAALKRAERQAKYGGQWARMPVYRY